MMQTVLGWSLVALVFLVFVFNGVIMLASPKDWFRLPTWMSCRGGLTEAKYGRGWGLAQVRILGGVMVAVPLWILYDFLSK